MAAPIGPIITAGASLLGQGMNAASQGNMNRKNRKFQEHMMNRQREWALADWNMQNEYNSPTSQMARLREAGLNPNMVYGQGATATSGSMPRSTPSAVWSPKAAQFDLGSTMAQFFDTQAKQAQIDNLKAQNTLILNQASLAAAQSKDVSAQTLKRPWELNSSITKSEHDELDYRLARSLASNTYQVAEENLRKLRVGTDLSIQRFSEEVANWQSQRQHTQLDMDRLRASIDNLIKDGILKQKDIDLEALDLKRGDSYLWKQIARIMDMIIPTKPKIGGWYDPKKK